MMSNSICIQVAIALLPILGGSLSLFASLFIIFQISRSDSRLKAPYSRLIFGLSFHDVLLSLCNIASTFAIPQDSSISSSPWGAHGNDITCSVQGTVLAISSITSPFYNFALCIYYLCVVKYSMSDERFSKNVEPALHIASILFMIGTVCFLIVGGVIGNAGDMCWIATSSSNTSHDEEEAASRRYFILLKWLLAGLPLLLIFCSSLFVMGLITWKVYQQEKDMDQYRFQPSSTFTDRRMSSIPGTSTRARRSRRKVKAVRTQTNLYIMVFLLTYGPTFVYRILQAKLSDSLLNNNGDYYQDEAQDSTGSSTVNSHTETMAMVVTLFAVLSRILYPLHGIMNIMVHVQPRASSLCQAHRDYHYLKACYIAIKTYDQGLDRRMCYRTYSNVLNRRRSSGNGRRGFTSATRRGSGMTSITTGGRLGSNGSGQDAMEYDPQRHHSQDNRRRRSSICGSAGTTIFVPDEGEVVEERIYEGSVHSQSPYDCKEMLPQQQDSEQYLQKQTLEEEKEEESPSRIVSSLYQTEKQMYENIKRDYSTTDFLSLPEDGQE